MLNDVLFKNRNKLNLQLFADEPAEPTTEPTGGTNEPATEPKSDNKPAEPEKKYSDDDVDKIIKQKKAEWDRKKAEDEKVAKMNADQKAQYELDKERKEKEDLQKKLDRYELGKTATSLLRESDIEATDDVLNFVIADDEEQTKANVKSFVAIVEEQVKKSEKARATGTTPKAFANSGNPLSEIEKRIAKYQ